MESTSDPDPKRSPNDERIQELILYVARKCECDSKCGATKLNKILFYSDFLAYRQFGRSITGHAYRRLSQGPVPHLMPRFQNALIDNDDAAIQERDYFGRRQKRLIALREPDLDGISGDEIAIVDEVIGMLKDMSAKEVSDLSHEFLGWQAASDGEQIPYATAFVFRPEVSEDIEAHAAAL